MLYTDGLIEYGHDAVAGETHLHEVLSDWARSGFIARANELAERALGMQPAKDDAAMLIVRLGRAGIQDYPSERRIPARSAADIRS